MTQLSDALAVLREATRQLQAVSPGWDKLNVLDAAVRMIAQVPDRFPEAPGLPVFLDAIDARVMWPAQVIPYQTNTFAPNMASSSPYKLSAVGVANCACPWDESGLFHLFPFPGISAVIVLAENAAGIAMCTYEFHSA